MKYVDVHGHCVLEHYVPYKRPGPPVHELSNPDDMLEFYEMHGIEKGVIHPAGNGDDTMQSQSNEEVLHIAKLHPGRFIPFCNVDPRNFFNDMTSPFEDALKWYRDKGCKGLGEMCCSLHFLDPRVQALFKAAEAVGFPVTFHMAPFTGNNYGLVDLPGMPELEETLRRFPTLKILGHSQAFWCEIGKYRGQAPRFGYPAGPVDEGALPKMMRKYPNLYGDLSAGSGCGALMRDRAYAAKFLTEFQDRLLFGLDICSPENERKSPHKLPAFLRELAAKGEISQGVFEKVARGNAIRVLGI